MEVLHDVTDSGGGVRRAGSVAFIWSNAGFGVSTIARFGLGAVLARQLGPEPFGQVAIALLVIGLGGMITDFGLGNVIIQTPDLTRDLVGGCFATQVLLSIILSIAWLFITPVILAFTGIEGAYRPIASLGMVFLLTSLGQTPIALLRRSFQIRFFQTVQVVSYVASYSFVAIPLAFLGAGVWSLVLAQVLQSGISSLILLVKTRESLAFRHPIAERGILGSGSRIAGSNLLDWVITNADTLIVGRVFGPLSLGLYNRSFFTVYSPAGAVTNSMKSVFLPVLSRLSGDEKQVRSTLLTTLQLTTYVSVAAFLCIAAVSETLILTVYGPGWQSAANLVPGLAIAMPALIAGSIVTATLWSRSAEREEFKLQLVASIVGIPILLTSSAYGLIAMTVAVASVYYLRLVILTFSLKRHFGFGIEECKVLLKTVSASVGIALLVKLLDSSLTVSLVPKLGLDILLGALLLGVIPLLFPCYSIGNTGLRIRLKVIDLVLHSSRRLGRANEATTVDHL